MSLPQTVTWADAGRRAAFEQWLAPLVDRHGLQPASLRPASADASFRRYLRIDTAAGGPLIVMDAPPPQEDVRPFVALAAQLERAALTAPRVLAEDAGHGFLLLSDLGEALLLRVLDAAAAAGETARVDALMREAAATLVAWQQRIDPAPLPPYDEALLRRELALFPEWCVGREHGVQWNEAQQRVWERSCDLLVESALAQPCVAVHRDYMPRNLMVVPGGGLGILDFQDAARGPVTYDVASLIRDAFLSWEEPFEIDIAARYWQQARAAGLPVDEDFGEFWRQLEWMGLQRHLKVLGIFCRLRHRDGKPRYSEDLPRFFGYAHRVASRYQPLRPLIRLLEPLMGEQRVDAFY